MHFNLNECMINEKEPIKNALLKLEQNSLGIVMSHDDNRKIVGVLTDGDIRRKLLNVQKPLSALFSDYSIDHASTNPTTCKENETLRSAVELMEKKQIWDLPVINDNGDLVGLLHLHAAIKHLL